MSSVFEPRAGGDSSRYSSEGTLPAVTTQTDEAKGEMQFRVFDWRRIRRDIKRLHPSWASAWFSVATLFFGVGAGAGISLISLYNGVSSTAAGKPHPKTWVVAVHIGVAGACFVGFVLCALVGVIEYHRYKRRKNDLANELDIFEATFQWVSPQREGEGGKITATLAEGVTVDEARRRRERAGRQA